MGYPYKITKFSLVQAKTELELFTKGASPRGMAMLLYRAAFAKS